MLRSLIDNLKPYCTPAYTALATWGLSAWCAIMVAACINLGADTPLFPLIIVTICAHMYGWFYWGKWRGWWTGLEQDVYDDAPTPIEREAQEVYSPKYLRSLRMFSQFIIVIASGNASQNAAIARMQPLYKEFDRPLYDAWIIELENIGIVQNNGQGKGRVVLVTNPEEALTLVAQKIYHDLDVWEPIIPKVERIDAHRMRVVR